LRYAVKFAYNGLGFHGYARQPNLKTIEGEIIKSFIKNGFFEDTKEANFRSASRTDKDVSALGNVIAFNSDQSKNDMISYLQELEDEIIFYGIKEVKDDFNPRFAKLRFYRYYLKIDDFDVDKIINVLSCFTGKHDFSNFAKIEEFKNPIRVIENIVCEKSNDLFKIDFFAPNFLWSQIRRIISSICKVSAEKISKEEVIEALNNPDRIVDFGLAKAKPLILKDIFYDFEFEIYKKQLSKINDLERKIMLNL